MALPGGCLSRDRIFSRPLPHLNGDWLTRALTRGTLAAFRHRVINVCGLEHIAPDRDPFILALNHSQRAEAILIPALLFFLRDGKRVHFMADWNFCLIPPVALFYQCGQVIMLTRKSARPRFLNIFKPLFAHGTPAFVRARQRLESGASVGVFPEGTVNRNPQCLLKGYSGAARLSLETGSPVVPAGVRFPGQADSEFIPDSAPFCLEIGAPMKPPPLDGAPSLSQVRDWHDAIMSNIGRLAHKNWQPQTHRKNHGT